MALSLKFLTFLAILVLGLIELNVVGVDGVVVDGNKKKDVSAAKGHEEVDEKEVLDSYNTKTCGISDPNFEEHEFVNMAREGQFPWMVSFQLSVPLHYELKGMNIEALESSKKSNSTGNENVLEKDLHFCCGSFISDRWILSAAHCFESKSMKNYLDNGKLKVVAGSHKVSSRSSLNANLTIKRIFTHSSFDKKVPIGFDIALVELENPVKFTQKRVKSELNEQKEPFMNTICLPKADKRYNFNETARIAGWGLSDEKDETSMPSKLLTTDILISKTDECAANFSKSLNSEKPKEQSKKYDDFICASFKNTRDACQSDSGGPLVQYANGKGVVIGIVSYGIGCATKGVPGLYTRTSAYINWIKEITKYGEKSSVSFKSIGADNKKSPPPTTTSPVKSESTTAKPIAVTTSAPTTSTSTTGKPATKSTESDKSNGKNKFKFFDD